MCLVLHVLLLIRTVLTAAVVPLYNPTPNWTCGEHRKGPSPRGMVNLFYRTLRFLPVYRSAEGLFAPHGAAARNSKYIGKDTYV